MGFLDPDEIKLFLKAAEGDKAEIEMLLELHGLRESECMYVVRHDMIDTRKNIIYVNGAYKAKPGEETELSKLIHDFHCAKPEDMYIPALAKAVHEHKYTERGQRKLSNAMKELIEQEVEKEKAALQAANVRNLMVNLDLTAEQAMDALMIPAENREGIKKRLEEIR